MPANLEATLTVDDKARELCEFVTDLPSFREAHERINAFLEDKPAKAAYQAWQSLGQELHQLQHAGTEPTRSQIAEFEKLRAAVAANPVAAGFMDAEAEMNAIFSTVTKLLQKTLQTGQVPSEAEMAVGESCGSGCGCH